MLNTCDALQAHHYCKGLIARSLEQPLYGVESTAFDTHHECRLMQFIRECEHRCENWLEIDAVKTAHHCFHEIAMDLARKRCNKEPIDTAAEMGPASAFTKASTNLVSALWKLEHRLHSMAR